MQTFVTPWMNWNGQGCWESEITPGEADVGACFDGVADLFDVSRGAKRIRLVMRRDDGQARRNKKTDHAAMVIRSKHGSYEHLFIMSDKGPYLWYSADDGGFIEWLAAEFDRASGDPFAHNTMPEETRWLVSLEIEG